MKRRVFFCCSSYSPNKIVKGVFASNRQFTIKFRRKIPPFGRGNLLLASQLQVTHLYLSGCALGMNRSTLRFVAQALQLDQPLAAIGF